MFVYQQMGASPMRVLGVDPGLTRCGVGVVEGDVGRSLKLVVAGVVRTCADLEHSRRLLAIEEDLEQAVLTHRPDAMAVERVFAQHNLMTVTGTAQAAGVAMLVAARHGIPVMLHTPSEVKASITGNGRADKAQVGAMVARILHLDAPPAPADAADAVAIAICHIWRGGATNRYRVAAETATRSTALAARRLEEARKRAANPRRSA